MLVFLDIGAHRGQTLWEVLKPKYAFDKIYAFEPRSKEYNILDNNHGHEEHLEILPFGLADCTSTMELYGTNRRGAASIYPEKINVDPSFRETCSFVEASLFFRTHLSADDINIVKINCEGGEVPIVNNLIDSGEIWKISAASICWDADKIPGMEEITRQTQSRLKEIGFTRHELPAGTRKVYGRTHQDRIGNWLSKIGYQVLR